jgi:uncharacterized paraquat-inducible protein A
MSQITAKTLEPKKYHACHACDLLVYNTDVSPGEKAICPRCGTLNSEFLKCFIKKRKL